MIRRVGVGPLWLALLLLVDGCGPAEPWHGLFPDDDAIPGWTPGDEVEVYDGDNLYDLVNGQADAFFVYGFERVYVQAYESAAGGLVRVEVWQLDTASNAYGLFTMLRSGEAVDIGNGGNTDPGRRVDFWQDRSFVRVFSFAPEDPATLEMFAGQVSNALPAGGQRPPLARRLPEEELVPDSELFFHQEISIQDYLWLGGENILSLGAETDAILAHYEIHGAGAWLLLVEYPEEAGASGALDKLHAVQLENMSAAAVQGQFLGAVFGALPKTDAEQLLMIALAGGG